MELGKILVGIYEYILFSPDLGGHPWKIWEKEPPELNESSELDITVPNRGASKASLQSRPKCFIAKLNGKESVSRDHKDETQNRLKVIHASGSRTIDYSPTRFTEKRAVVPACQQTKVVESPCCKYLADDSSRNW